MNGCRREHVGNGDVLLDLWDQAALRALLAADEPLPASSGKFISAIQQCDELEGHFHSLGEAWGSSKRLHTTMVKLQILGLVDPRQDSCRRGNGD